MQHSVIEISEKEYAKISQLVYNRFGINLGTKKQSLVMNRLRKVLLENNFNNFEQFYKYIQEDKSGVGLDILINKISTNLTYFARENEHFNYLQETVIPALRSTPKVSSEKAMRIWCAGCSTGEEAYTLAMVMRSAYKNTDNWNLGVLATDISARALEIAKTGIYSADNVKKLSDPAYKNGFIKVPGDKYQVQSEIQKLVLFRRLNLMRAEFPFQKKFHTIFCRNVMIYFDSETRKNLIKKFHQHLVEGGYLFIGHSESLGRDNPYFKYIRPAVYARV